MNHLQNLILLVSLANEIFIIWVNNFFFNILEKMEVDEKQEVRLNVFLKF